MKLITCSKHSIEEYIKDNPKSRNPEKSLIFLFKDMLYYKAKFHKWENANIIRYKDQAIVYKDYHIITYYRIIHLRTAQYKRKIVAIIEKILNWTAEKEFDLKLQKERRALEKRNSKKYTKRNRKILNENKKSKVVYFHLGKIFK